MVCGPASSPSESNVSRRFTIYLFRTSETRVGDVLGRRDLGSNASSPSDRYLANSRDTVDSDSPNSRAVAAWESPSRVTDMMMARRFDMPATLAHRSCICPEHDSHTALQMS